MVVTETDTKCDRRPESQDHTTHLKKQHITNCRNLYRNYQSLWKRSRLRRLEPQDILHMYISTTVKTASSQAESTSLITQFRIDILQKHSYPSWNGNAPKYHSHVDTDAST